MKRYSSSKYSRTPAPKHSPGSHRLAVCLLLCALTLACKFYYPQGVTALQDLIIGSEGGRIRSAVQALSLALDDGRSLPDAAEAFWQGMRVDTPS